MFYTNKNELNRQSWLQKNLSEISPGSRILDAGAGELKNRKYCTHMKYVSQDFCQYKGRHRGAIDEGLQNGVWDTSHIDIISDITNIPEPDDSFDVILCSEVLEHIPEPTHALDEFSRLLKPNGILLLTAPFNSLVHMAPYHFCSGFSKFWYEHHLSIRNFTIKELIANGDYFSYIGQELFRLGSVERKAKNIFWPISYVFSIFSLLYFRFRIKKKAMDLACFGWCCKAIKNH